MSTNLSEHDYKKNILIFEEGLKYPNFNAAFF